MKNFFKGMMNSRVDYATRHHSNAYDWGQATGGILVFIVFPFCIVFAAGFAAGRYF